MEIVCDHILQSKKPTISVIIITYNHEKYIAQTIDSILAQELRDTFELIIGEDGSTDKTRDICRAYQKRFPEHVKLLLPDTNQGLMKNYLAVLNACRGDFIAQIAGDDYWTDNQKLAKQVEILRSNPDCGLVYTDVDYYYEETRKVDPKVFESNYINRTRSFEEHLYTRGFLAPLTWMYRKEVSPITFGYEGKNYVDESFAYMLDIFKTSKIYYLADTTAVRRVIVNSLSHQKDLQKKYNFEYGLFQIQKEYLVKYDADQDFSQRVINLGYLQLLQSAMQIDKQNIPAEIIDYFESKNIPTHFLIEKYVEALKWNRTRDMVVGSPFFKIAKPAVGWVKRRLNR